MELTADKAQVPRRFDRAARTYDLLTGMNPGYGRHLRLSAARLEVPHGGRLLDLCCGTGLSTAALLQACAPAELVGLDYSAGMLDEARRKGLVTTGGPVTFVHGDATDPAAAGVCGPFDGILMAYGIRNVPDPDLCLHNLLPLLRPGGRIVFHEYSVAGSTRSRAVWNAVALGIIVPGGLVTGGSTEIYRYLRRSVNAFDSVDAFERRLLRAGFRNVRTLPMDGWQRGIVHSFVAERPR